MRVFIAISLVTMAVPVAFGQSHPLTEAEQAALDRALEKTPGISVMDNNAWVKLLDDADIFLKGEVSKGGVTAASVLRSLLIRKQIALFGKEDAKARAASVAKPGVSLDFQIKGSPATMAIGASPDMVPSPTTLRALAMSVINGLDREGNYKGGIGVEFAPFKDSIKGLKLSAAFVKGAAKDDPSARAGIGIRYSFIDKPDDDAPGDANDNVKKEREIMEEMNPRLADVIVLGALVRSGAFSAEIDAFQGTAFSKEEAARIMDTLKSAELLERTVADKGKEKAENDNWTKQQLEASVGSGFIDESGGGSLDRGGTMFMVSFTHPIGKPQTEKQKAKYPGSFLLGYSQNWNRRVADAKVTGGFSDEDSRTLGIGAKFGTNKLSYDFKLLGTQFRRDSGWKQKLDAVLGIGVRVSEDNWLSLSLIGKLAGETDNRLKLSFTYSFGSKGDSTAGKGAAK